MNMKIVIYAALCLLLTACGGPAATGDRSGDSELMGLDEEPGAPVWRGWGAEGREAAPEGFGDEVAAFDYWQVDDERLFEEAWSGASSLLDYLRRDELPEAQREAATVLLQALDSDRARMDVTFVVEDDEGANTEGLVVRLYRALEEEGAVPTFAVYAERSEEAREGFDRLYLWANPGFAEAEAFTVAVDDEGGWRARRADGLVYPAPAEAEPVLDEAADLAVEIADERFWKPFSGPGFVEARSRVDTDDEVDLPDPLQPALGLDERDRDIEEVYEETSFPPRMDSDPFE